MLHVQFNFRNRLCQCDYIIDSSAYPGYIFTFFTDKELIAEFSADITIKTDFYKLLPKNDDYGELIKLRQVIFNAIYPLDEFAEAKKQLTLIESPEYKKEHYVVNS
jgi:hypothetical protein